LQKLAKQIVNEELSARRCQQLGSALLLIRRSQRSSTHRRYVRFAGL